MATDAMDGLVRRMEQQLALFDRRRDHRAAFLRVYTHMTRKVRRRMQGPGFFLDNAWMERVALRFADMYFGALAAFDQGGRPPPAWDVAFESAVRRRCFLLQDIVLGVNAHINNDLPQVLAAILRDEGDWPDSVRLVRRRFDHDQINRILYEIIPAVEGEAARHYGRLVAALGWVMGGLDEALATFELAQFRHKTWRNAQFLLAARDQAERADVVRWIEQDAQAVAQVVLRYTAPRWLSPLAGPARRLRLC